jgi:hypothetical protein
VLLAAVVAGSALVVVASEGRELGVALGLVLPPPVRPRLGDPVWGALSPTTPALPASFEGLVRIPLNPTVEYDGATRADILARRGARVSEHAEALAAFGSVRWAPSPAVFGQIVDGKPWWGLVGIARRGSGEQSIEGDSEESRFIENPLLLFAPKERFAHVPHDRGAPATPLWPRARTLAWDFEHRIGLATIDAASYLEECRRLRWPDCIERRLSLRAYNVHDLGVPWFAYDAAASQRVAVRSFGKVLAEPEYIHLGGSCGHAGGCNNASPYAPDLEVVLAELPARLAVRLWRQAPRAADDPPDAWFVLVFE